MPSELEFYFGGFNPNFFKACAALGLTDDNSNFVDILASDIGSKILGENMLSIHIETGNIFFDGCNTNKSIYDFLIRQQDETKKIIHVTLTYKDSFSNYIFKIFSG